MTFVRTLFARLRSIVTRTQQDTALAEEIECHLEMLAAEFRASGVPDSEARTRARREFGSVDRVKESAREARGFPVVESFWRDIVFALRQLRRTPSFTLAATLTLAIGVGGTTGIFSVLDVVAFRELSYPAPDRLVVIHERLPRFGPFPASAADAEFWSRHATSFEQIALVNAALMNLTGAGDPERLQVGQVSPGFLAMLGARAQVGRLLLDSEAQQSADAVVVLSDPLWRRRFGADPQIVGRSVVLDGVPHQVVGVMSADFKAPNIRHLFSIPVPEMVLNAWKPLALAPEERPAIGGYSYPALARLKAGISVQRAQQELDVVQAELRRTVPGKGELAATVVPLQSQMASRSRPTLLLLLAATAAVLLIGCVNTTNLLSARILARRREIAVRAAIGAGRWRLVRQILVENAVLGALGGAAGIVVAFAVMRIVVSLAPGDVPRLDEVALDARALLFAAIVSIGCGLLIGLPSAWRLGASDLRSWLGNRTEVAASQASYAVLVVCEIGLCAACVGVGFLLAESFRGLNSVDKGFDPARILTASVSVPPGRYQTADQQAALFDAVSDDIRAMPGVAAVAVSTQLPLTGTGALSALSVEGGTAPPAERPSADVRSVSLDYFRVVNVPLLRGRLLEPQDRNRTVAVLSEQLAARGWPGENPLGRRFRFGANPTNPVYEVVGIVGDVRGTALDQPVTPTAYVPFPQRVRGIAGTDGEDRR